ncbi:MAG: hypothetical protein QFB86_00365 [Patescibacteria group bacterium]|nr:hypothetical protein [Patescibacteria group bacterium]
MANPNHISDPNAQEPLSIESAMTRRFVERLSAGPENIQKIALERWNSLTPEDQDRRSAHAVIAYPSDIEGRQNLINAMMLEEQYDEDVALVTYLNRAFGEEAKIHPLDQPDIQAV